MPRYRVTYVESVLREKYISARNADAAEAKVRAERDDAQHHHVADAWDDDWQAQPVTADENRQPCYECGR